jgi:hypothetical protein
VSTGITVFAVRVPEVSILLFAPMVAPLHISEIGIGVSGVASIRACTAVVISVSSDTPFTVEVMLSPVFESVFVVGGIGNASAKYFPSDHFFIIFLGSVDMHVAQSGGLHVTGTVADTGVGIIYIIKEY